MLQWFNRNAAAIQALGSMASVATTVALLWITARYVALTEELARAARQQLRIQQQSAVSETARLITLVDVFIGTLRRFPREQDSEALRNIALWKRSDVTALATLAASVIGAETPVRQTIQSLNWLHDRADQLQQQPDTPHGDTSEQWTHELEVARRSLLTLRTAAAGAQRTLAAPADDDAEMTQPQA